MDPQMVTKAVDNGHVGLHKILGTTAEAIVGGLCHQFVRFPVSLILPLRSTIVLTYLLITFPESCGGPQIVPRSSPPFYPPKRHAPKCSRCVPLTSYTTLQERERMCRPLITIPTRTIGWSCALSPVLHRFPFDYYCGAVFGGRTCYRVHGWIVEVLIRGRIIVAHPPLCYR